MSASFWAAGTFFFAASIGLFIAAAEIATRYPGSVGIAFRQPMAAAYLLMNAAICIIVLIVLRDPGVPVATGLIATPAGRLVSESIAAGLLGATLLRSSLFTAREIAIGPAILPASMLGSLDRSVDRASAVRRIADVEALMRGISFDHARVALPPYLLALWPDNRAAKDLGLQLKPLVEAISSQSAPDATKSVQLGMILANQFGSEFLKKGVEALSPLVREDMPPVSVTPPSSIDQQATVLSAIAQSGRARLDELRDFVPNIPDIDDVLETLQKRGLIDKVAGPIAELSTFVPSPSGLAEARRLASTTGSTTSPTPASVGGVVS